MLITRTSVVSGVTRTLDLPITEQQYNAWENGVVAQRAFSNLTADQREFIISGILGDEWNDLFGIEE